MSDKTRIHELAKQYGMPGKDLAARLRENGFDKAKTHMSALDPMEVIQAQALLEAIGVMPTSQSSGGGAPEETRAAGGLVLRRKKKKKVEDEEPAEESADEESEPAEEPAPVEARPSPAPRPSEEPSPAPTAEVERAPSPAPAPAAEPAAEPAVEPAAADTAGAAAPDEAPTPVAPTPAVSGDAASPADPTTPVSAPDAPSTGAQSATEVIDAAAPTPTEPAPIGAPAASGSSDAAAPPTPEGGVGRPTTAGPAPTAPGTVPAAKPKAPAPGKAPKAPEKSSPSPRGKIVGRIDPATLQTQRPERKRQSRRLLSRDDVAPDVQPTFGRGGGNGAPRGGTGQRGNLTASELREREQGRFLRRNRQGGAQGQRRSGRPVRRATITDSPLAGQVVTIEMPITISKLAETLKLKSAVLISHAMKSQLGFFTMNSPLDEETAVLIADEFDVELDVRLEVSAEQAHLDEVRLKRSEVEEDDLEQRAPCIAFLGHVDHGKTSLIDWIRQTKIAAGEAGGITQHIGAYQVTTDSGQRITILDTPGHQAFTAMRARGAKAVDVVVLVVAGDDGVKPSTEEAINHAKAAGTPIVVAVNKKDKPGYNFNATVQQLMGHELVPEVYGGHTAMFETDALSGDGVDALLDHIVLMSEAQLDLRAHPNGPATGVVLEAEIQQGRGIVAHLLVQDGTLSKGDVLLAGEGYGKIKSIVDDRGNQVGEAGPSMPVEVTGLDALPGVGDTFYIVESLAKAKEIAEERAKTNRAMVLAASRKNNPDLDRILGKAPAVERESINLIVRADVQGSVEVIRHEIAKLEHEEVEVKLVHSGVGAITESDVDLAEASGALLVAFHVAIPGRVRQEAERRRLQIRRYDVIYELLDALRDQMEGALAPEYTEQITGHTEIKALFKSSKIGLIAGCQVLDGKLNRNNRIRLLRDDLVVHTGGIASLRRESDDVRDVREGFECGVVLKDYRDIRVGDIIESFEIKEVKRTLA